VRFFGCTPDLEDELIRAIGAEQVERLVEAEGGIVQVAATMSRFDADINIGWHQ
jgi:hypothetical protein